MVWTVEYYEQEDETQPAEDFEDRLYRDQPKLAGKLLRLLTEVEQQVYNLGGGYLEPCHDYTGLREVRARQQQWLAREFLGFDGDRIVLLHGYVKRVGQPAVAAELDRASDFPADYLKTRRISPEEEERNDSL